MNAFNETQNGSFTIQQLPDAVLLQIFSHFSHYDISTKFALVCRQWSQLSKHKSFGTVMSIVGRSKFKSTLSKATRLKQLTVRHVDLAAVVALLSKNCPLLEKFCVTDGIMQYHILEKLIENCTAIMHLDLRGCLIKGCDSYNLDNFAMFAKLKKLRVLKSSASSRMPFDGRDLAAIAEKCVDLEFLDLECQDLDDSYVFDEVVVEIVKHRHGSLKYLYLKFEHLSDIAFTAIGKCTQLTQLRLEHAYLMSDEGLLALSQLSNLVELRLLSAGEGTSSEGFAAMFSGPNMKNLVRLDLSECFDVNDEVVRMIANCCSRSLSWLALKRCTEITDKGVQDLVQQCRCLKYIDLRQLKISTDALVDIPTLLPELTFIDLEGCDNIKGEAMQTILGQTKDTVIMDRFGSKTYTIMKGVGANPV